MEDEMSLSTVRKKMDELIEEEWKNIERERKKKMGFWDEEYKDALENARGRALKRGEEFIKEYAGTSKEKVIKDIAWTIYNILHPDMGVHWFGELSEDERERYHIAAREAYNLVEWSKK